MVKFTKEFKDTIISKMLPPNAKSVPELAEETGVNKNTLYSWKSQALKHGITAVGRDSPAHHWSDESKLAVIIETSPLNEAELGAYCREKGRNSER